MSRYLGILLCAVALTTCGWATQAVAVSPEGSTYSVTVRSSNGSQFSDVFRFLDAGIFIVDGLGIGEWDAVDHNLLASFDASASDLTGFTVDFSGFTFFSDGAHLLALGTGDDGTFYLVQGDLNDDSPTVANTGNWTSRRAAPARAAGRR